MRKVYLYNTLTRQKEEFVPINEGEVKIYNCGPTVYDYQHIGNMYAAVFADNLRRSLKYLGYKVTQVMNITDVGHLVSDEDEGEDKMVKGARKMGKSIWEVAELFTAKYLDDVRKLNVEEPEIRPKASDHIEEMIEIIK